MTKVNDRILQARPRRFRQYSAYKDSGVEWLGEIPAHWEVKPFKALLVRNDSGVWGEDSASEGTIVLRSTEQSINGEWSIDTPAIRMLTAREAAQAQLEIGDLVVTKSSGSHLHIGKTSIVDESIAELRCGFSNFMQRLRVDCQHEARFFWYLMNAPVAREQLVFLSSTTTGLGNLNASILGAIRVAAAPLIEQRAIATFLDRETAKIEGLVARKERLIDLLREKRTALITRAVTRGLDPNVPVKDSGVEWLGEIPAHWKVKPFKALLVRNDSGVWGEDSASEGTIVLRSTEQSINGEWSIDTPAIRMLTAREAAQAQLEIGDLVVTKSSGSHLHIGKTSIVDESIAELRCGFSNFMQRLRVDCQHEARFFWYLMNAPVAREQLVFLSSTTTGLGNLNASILGAIRVAAAPLIEQRAIAAFLDREAAKIDMLIARVQGAVDLLKEFRTALISAAVTGKIDVREEAA